VYAYGVSDKARLFLILWLVGLAGVLSILSIDLPAHRI